MKIRVRKTVVVLSAVCALGWVAAGCGSDSEPPVEVVANEIEKSEDPGAEEIDAVQGNPDREELQEDSGERWHVLSPEVAAVVDADFIGTVWKIDEDSFYIVEDEIEIMDDGSINGSCFAPGAQIPESDLIQVVFDENTYFYIRTIYGNSYEDVEAEFQNLETNLSVEMKGEFIDDIFHANQIRVIKVS